MSDTIRRAVELAHHGAFEDPFDGAAPTLGLALAREAVGRLAWEMMRYRCRECGFAAPIWLTLGVEGPPALRELNVYVACPFMVKCWACSGPPRRQGEPVSSAPYDREPLNGTMQHVGLDNPLRALVVVPDDEAYFVLPDRADRGDSGASLVLPDEARVFAQRWFFEEAPRG